MIILWSSADLTENILEGSDYHYTIPVHLIIISLIGRCQDGTVLIIGRCQYGMVFILGRSKDGMVLILGRCWYSLILSLGRCKDGMIFGFLGRRWFSLFFSLGRRQIHLTPPELTQLLPSHTIRLPRKKIPREK